MGSRRGEDGSSLSGGAANNSLSDKALESLILADILTGTKFWSPLAYIHTSMDSVCYVHLVSVNFMLHSKVFVA